MWNKISWKEMQPFSCELKSNAGSSKMQLVIRFSRQRGLLSQFIAISLFARGSIGSVYFILLYYFYGFCLLILAIAWERVIGSVCVSTLICFLFDSKDPDHLYFVHISLPLCSSLEQTEQTVGIPGKKLKEAHPEVKACSIITAWLETTGQSPQ